ncbi:MAG: hypothetical protein ABJC89_11760 [Acidobacteriota bacterium]
MTLFDLAFVISFLVTVVALIRACYLLLRKRMAAAKQTATRLVAFVAIYAVTLVVVSLTTPQTRLHLGDVRCFDEWCITVTGASRQPSIADVSANGLFYVVTVQVSSRARGRRQREVDVDTYLTDTRGRRFDVSPAGQGALQRAGLAGAAVTSFVDPGATFESRLAYDVPKDVTDLGFVKTSHGWFPTRLIIGESSSFLHRPTIVQLGPS